MKNSTTALLSSLVVAIILLFTSCTKDPFTFTLPLPEISSSTGVGYAPGSIIVYSAGQYLVDIQEEIEKNGGKLSNLKSVKFKSGNLKITSAGQNFNNIDYIEAFIKASSLDSMKLAYKTDIPKTGLTSIDMESQYSELSEYFKKDTVAISVRGYNSAAIPPLDFKVNISVDITVAQD